MYRKSYCTTPGISVDSGVGNRKLFYVFYVMLQGTARQAVRYANQSCCVFLFSFFFFFAGVGGGGVIFL